MALVELRRAQAQFEAVVDRMAEYKILFREERDEAVRQAAELDVPTKVIAGEIKVSSVWVNKLLRGEAYRRATD